LRAASEHLGHSQLAAWSEHSVGWRRRRFACIFIHRAFSKDRIAFSLPARDCFLQAAFEWLCWFTLLTDDTIVRKSCQRCAFPCAGLAFSKMDLARHPTSSVLLILASPAHRPLHSGFTFGRSLSGLGFSDEPAALSLHCHICAAWVDSEVFTLALLRWLRAGAPAVLSLFLCAGFGRASAVNLAASAAVAPWCLSLLTVASSGLLFSPASSLGSALTFSVGAAGFSWLQRRRAHLVSLRGSLATAVSLT
jgi:hypothetical protein